MSDTAKHNAVAKANNDALQTSCATLRSIMQNMGYAEVEDVLYSVVRLERERKRRNYYLARVQTPLRDEFGEPQRTEVLAKQSAAYAALLYYVREMQFVRNFAAAPDNASTPRAPGRRKRSKTGATGEEKPFVPPLPLDDIGTEITPRILTSLRRATYHTQDVDEHMYMPQEADTPAGEERRVQNILNKYN
jgi:hypothetical protein